MYVRLWFVDMSGCGLCVCVWWGGDVVPVCGQLPIYKQGWLFVYGHVYVLVLFVDRIG